MVNDFFINGKRAYEKFGLRMSEDFIPALLTPPPLKDFIENKYNIYVLILQIKKR